ncbi:MAG: hypothetical protein QOI38_2243 [Sphingomonadales bacterium]|jgi:hypothetical protein|nr:hypothetical protein [Sphingomonadales bacterium]
MDAERLKRIAFRWLPGMAAGLLLGLLLGTIVLSSAVAPAAADPQRIADASLLSVREQGRITSLVARYAAIVTSSETRLGLEARKTLILPALVRYGIDLRRLRREHLAWDGATRTLSVVLPPLEISGPDIAMDEAREYSEGGVLMALTGAEAELDEANRLAAERELMRQARAPEPIGAARDAAMRMVARGFALPLRAAGIEASVSVRFTDPAGADLAVHLDRPPRVEDPVADRQAGARPGTAN